MHSITITQWIVMAVGAFGVGLSKTGIAGLGIVAVAFFAVALPAKISVGVVLPVLITGDICAVSLYRRKAVWRHLVFLFPWAMVGVVAGYFALGRIDNEQVGRLIGVILIVLSIVQILRRRQAEPLVEADTGRQGVAQSHLTMAIMGILAGFTTMVANAAGPIMILYLLATRLPKVEFIGTGAWYFFLLNLFKIPFSASLGLINLHTLPVDAELAPFVILGALAGRQIIHRIDQRLFENLAIGLTIAAAVKLLW